LTVDHGGHQEELPAEAGVRARLAPLASLLRGCNLPSQTWTRRHDGLLVVLALHVVGIFAFVAASSTWHVAWRLALVAATVLVASCPLRPAVRSSAVALGLFGCSAIIISLSNGAAEAHYHLFLVLALVSLYQDLVPYVVGIMFVFAEHLAFAALSPQMFESGLGAVEWALVHAGFVAAVSVAHMVSWSTSELHSRRRRLELANEVSRLAAIVDGTDLAVLSMDVDGTIRSWNSGASRLFGYTQDEILGQRVHCLVTEEHEQELEDNLRLAAGERSSSCETVKLHRYHGPVEVAATYSPVRDPAGDVIGVSLLARDISRQKQAERDLEGSQEELAEQAAELTQMAFQDSLTNLANRSLFLDRLAHSLQRPERGVVAVLVLDLDGFTLVNDSAGHVAGDALLQIVAGRLVATVREWDTVARLGGDEFAVLLEDVEPAEAVEVAESIVNELAEPYLVGERRFSTSASVGLVLSDGGDVTPEDLMRNADVAMHAAKAKGKGRYAVFDPSMYQAVIQRVETEAELQDGMQQGELAIHYQPLVDPDTGEIQSLEALVRWEHPTRGLVPPQQFIPLAEETGLIVPLGEWVLSEACAEARRIHNGGRPDVRISVNVSTRQLEEGDRLVQLVRSRLEELGLPPVALVIEVTEGALLQERGTPADTLQELRALGVKVAIDDFGTGYSSLGRLRALPVDILKIDRSFIAELDSGGDQAPILAAVVAMAHSLGLIVVAEGVETRDQYGALARLECDLAQGYLLSRPIPAVEVRELLAFRAPYVGLKEIEVVLDRTLGDVMTVVRDVVARAGSLEELVRPLLSVLQGVAGVQASYLTVIDWAKLNQTVLYAHGGASIAIREGLTLPWSQDLCREVLAHAPDDDGAAAAGRAEAKEGDGRSTDYPYRGPDGDLRLPRHCSVPVIRDDAVVMGVLGVAGGSPRLPHSAIHGLMEFVARLLSDRLVETRPSSTRPARVLIVDDSPVSRAVVRAALASSPLFEVAGEASDGAEGLALCDELEPDLVLLDMVMPGRSGLDVLATMRERHPDARVVALSASQTGKEEALALGVAAYVLKGTSMRDLLVTLTTLASGHAIESAMA
jgi:diguanylate cyclase (GGDEF)-like protein/PAS domain S-box-containing protein